MADRGGRLPKLRVFRVHFAELWRQPHWSLPSSPLWKRWRISYDAGLDEFKERAKQLDERRNQRSPVRSFTITRQKVGR
jgi:hypothetical protein